MKQKRLQNNRVPLVCAYRIMQGVYSPFIKRYKELIEDDYKVLFEKYISDSIDHLNHQNIQFFIDYNDTYTLNKISRVIVHLYNDYHKEFNDNLFYALERVFCCLKEDIKK